MPAGRRDLTARTVVTIDPVDARDFDDAISLERVERGHWLLGVHIADVSHFVRDGSPLDQEAKNRGTSVYLPDRVIPMIPEVVSNNLASLQPGRVRYARTCWMEFTPDGAPVERRTKAQYRPSKVVTMLTTSQPSADLRVNSAASASCEVKSPEW